MKYSCIIVEDNILERDALAINIRKINNLVLKESLSDGMEAVQYLRDNRIDIVFSDIDMPDLSGIELLKSIKNPPVFIFISSHPEHAAESFNLDVIDYIVKPAKLERVIKAADKAIEYIEAKKKVIPEQGKIPAPQQLSELVRTIDADEYFFIKEKNAYVKVNMGEVLYIESMGDFSKIITTSNKSYFILVSLKNLEKQLPAKLFIRVHKQYIVNLLHIIAIAAADIKLSGNVTIPLSSAHRQALLDNVVAKKTLTRFS
jgi:two-component system LytT family response regulator